MRRNRLPAELSLTLFLFTLARPWAVAITPIEFDLQSRLSRKQNKEACSFSHLFERFIGRGLWRIALDFTAANATERGPHASVQQPQIIVDFGLSGHGRARITRRVLLPDGDGGCYPAHFINIRLVHALEELAGVSRKRLDIAALALGIDRVERQRGFTRATDAGDHCHEVNRNRERDVLEIVDASAPYFDSFLGHDWCAPDHTEGNPAVSQTPHLNSKVVQSEGGCQSKLNTGRAQFGTPR